MPDSVVVVIGVASGLFGTLFGAIATLFGIKGQIEKAVKEAIKSELGNHDYRIVQLEQHQDKMVDQVMTKEQHEGICLSNERYLKAQFELLDMKINHIVERQDLTCKKIEELKRSIGACPGRGSHEE